MRKTEKILITLDALIILLILFFGINGAVQREAIRRNTDNERIEKLIDKLEKRVVDAEAANFK